MKTFKIWVQIAYKLKTALRLERLVARHVAHGRDPQAARAWARGTDQRNADLVAAGRALADLVVELPDLSR